MKVDIVITSLSSAYELLLFGHTAQAAVTALARVATADCDVCSKGRSLWADLSAHFYLELNKMRTITQIWGKCASYLPRLSQHCVN